MLVKGATVIISYGYQHMFLLIEISIMQYIPFDVMTQPQMTPQHPKMDMSCF